MMEPATGDRESRAAYLAQLRRTLEQNPKNAVAWIDLGWFHQRERQWAAAQESFEQATRMEPNNASAWHYLGACLGRQGNLERAAELLRHALTIDDRDAAIWHDLTAAYEKLGRPADAAAASEQVVIRRPGDVRALYAWAFNVRNTLDFDQALEILERALNLDPHHAECHTLRAVIWLAQGRLKEGWREYEWRRQMKTDLLRLRNYGTPEWKGDADVAGRRMLVYAEQGFGDTIQHIRYAAQLVRQGATVIAEVPRELVRLIGQADGVSHTVVAGTAPPPFDLYCSLMSLPWACQTEVSTIPAEVPYLRLRPEWLDHWGRRLGTERRGLRVGLAWAGSSANPHDVNRSCQPAALAPIIEVGHAARVQFYSLQKGPAGNALVAGSDMIDLMNEVEDFADTAALLSHLDLIISVDTSVVHLAGALAKPVWVLLPVVPGVVWMMGRSDSPWYPTMRLFRKTEKNDWTGPIEDVRSAFSAWIHEQSAARRD